MKVRPSNGVPMERSKNVTAVIGPTNTGKTHLAIERMLGHDSGMIGLPLRLLAREVYDRVVERIGPARVALITGEERIKPAHPSYYVCTVEAMPHDIDVDFLAIDEVQLAGDPERGHIFTDRLLHARGNSETLLLGAATMRNIIEKILPGTNFVTRPRLSKLTYGGQKKLSRLPRRTAIVAFSAEEVYSIAELIRRQRGGAAVVMGALSPRTRNAQVGLYQSGDVDFLIATDAIGMGLNLDIDHVAFAGSRKYDGHRSRDLMPSELAQIAGRAGRHMNDGTFGVTGNVEPFTQSIIDRLEGHEFEPLKTLYWRNRALDFSSVDQLKESLKQPSTHPGLIRGNMADDCVALENMSKISDVRDRSMGPAAVRRLWEVCQVPDYRKISTSDHVDLVAKLYSFLMQDDPVIPDDWLAAQVAFSDRTDGDIDTLANRIAHIRTWTFVSNKVDWMDDPKHWQDRTRAIEDSLSDALHEKLTQRFVDKRTSVLMRRLRDDEELFAEISKDGDVYVEKQLVGRLDGLMFTPAEAGEGINKKAAQSAAAHVLGDELSMRVRRIIAAKHDAFSLSGRGRLIWKDAELAKLEAGDDPLKPRIHILADEHLAAHDREKMQERLDSWILDEIKERLGQLRALSAAEDISGLGKGVAFQLVENFGVLRRESAAKDIASLDQSARAVLRKYGVRFGAFNIYLPSLLKPAASDLLLILWALKDGPKHGVELENMPIPPRGGLTSVATDPAVTGEFYKVSGFHICGPRSVRIDMLERLADMIRPLVAWRSGREKIAAKSPEKPAENSAGKPAGKPAEGLAESASGDTTEKTTGKVIEKVIENTIEPSVGAVSDKTDGAESAVPCKEPVKKAVSVVPPEGSTGDGGFVGTASMMSILGCSADELAQVLKSLGFRSEKKPKKPATKAVKISVTAPGEVKRASPDTTTINQGGSVDAVAAPVGEDVKPIADAVTSDSGGEVTAATESGPAKSDGSEAAEEEEFITIWRPSRRPRPRNQTKPREGSAGQRAKPGKGGGAGKRSERQRSGGANKPGRAPARARRPEKRADPDSPFAGLAKLKAELEQNPKGKNTR